MSTLYLYKSWSYRRVEVKAGYIGNDTEFVGMQVGGSLATGAQGVDAVLPFQAGMSYFPLTAPPLNVRVHGPRSLYLKIGGQRSLDAAGGLATQARNQSGFRFAPKGDKLLLINEAGYLRASSPTARYIWFRAAPLQLGRLAAKRPNPSGLALLVSGATLAGEEGPARACKLGLTSPAGAGPWRGPGNARLKDLHSTNIF